MLKFLAFISLFLISGIVPSLASWEKRCWDDGECQITSNSVVQGKGLTVMIIAYGDGASPDAVSIVVPLLGAANMEMRYVIPGVIDYKFTKNKCYLPLACSFVASIGAQGVADLKRASVLQLAVTLSDGRPEQFDVSLAGFTKAYNSKVAAEPLDAAPVEMSSEAEIEAEAVELRKKLVGAKAADASPTTSGEEPTTPSGSPAADGPDFDAWEKACNVETQSCAVYQRAIDGSDATFIFRSAPDGMRFEVWLPPDTDDRPGALWAVEGSNDHAFAITHCNLDYCVGGGVAGKADLAELTSAESLRVRRINVTGIELTDGISLKGFAAAYYGAPLESTTSDAVSPEKLLEHLARKLRESPPMAAAAAAARPAPDQAAANPTPVPKSTQPVLVEGTPIWPDWMKGCSGVDEQKECGTSAYLFFNPQQSVTMTILEDENGAIEALKLVMTSDGINLEAGVVVKVGKQRAVRFPIQDCVDDAYRVCVTYAKLPDGWIDWLRSDNSVEISFKTVAGRVDFSHSLSDFADAVDLPVAADAEFRDWRMFNVERGMAAP